jgi:solute carrier family 34 (sodium-dependent phosphate cotransporter)
MSPLPWLGLVGWLRRVSWRKVALFALALLLFILALQLLKTGAKALVPFVRDGLAVQNAANALGFGWLFAYAALSGSPVAATALTLFDAGALDDVGTFAMIAGSRLGAAFIVLAIGFVYTLRGHERQGSLAMGLLSFIITAAIYLPGLAVGYWLLQTGAFDGLRPSGALGVVEIIDVAYAPLVALAENNLPHWAVFGIGFGILWYSLNLIDHALPDMRLREGAFGGMARLLYRPLVTFALGLAVTTLTMSVSVSLSVLVPLSARGYIRRENVIPYIMGANITTFVDTLVAALLLNNPRAFTVVLVEMVSVALVSLVFLLLFYRPYERVVLRLVEFIGSRRLHMAVFLAIILAVPIALMLMR